MSQTIYVDRKDIRLKAERDTLVFYTQTGRRNTMPLKLMQRFVIRGHCQLDAQLLGKLADHDITTVILSARYSRHLAVIPAKKHNDARIRISQYDFYRNKAACLDATKLLVRAKLLRQVRFLNELMRLRPQQRKLLFDAQNQIRNSMLQIETHAAKSALLGIEGASAKAYFYALSGVFPKAFAFNGRNKRPPKDPVNAVLSFTYTLFNSRCVQALNTVGLDPMIGFYHELDYARNSLASDMIEPWRPLIDRFVWHLFVDKIFSKNDFEQVEEACLLNKQGRAKFYPVYEMQMHLWQKGLRRQARYFVNKLEQWANQYD
jgi:CRISPR-associated protein Cas1